MVITNCDVGGDFLARFGDKEEAKWFAKNAYRARKKNKDGVYCVMVLDLETRKQIDSYGMKLALKPGIFYCLTNIVNGSRGRY